MSVSGDMRYEVDRSLGINPLSFPLLLKNEIIRSISIDFHWLIFLHLLFCFLKKVSQFIIRFHYVVVERYRTPERVERRLIRLSLFGGIFFLAWLLLVFYLDFLLCKRLFFGGYQNMLLWTLLLSFSE